MKALVWNIRLVNTQKAFMRLVNMNKKHQFYIVGLMEPMEGLHELEYYRRTWNEACIY